MVNGENFERGDLTWMVEIYYRKLTKQPEYICGASVLSDHHVLIGMKTNKNLS